MREHISVEYIAPSSLKPYSNNPRIHSEQQISKLQASIQEYGVVLPVLVSEDNVIIAGHAVVQACMSLGLTEIPCVRALNLTEAQRLAYIIADNRLSEDSTWDKSLLKSEMLKLRDEYGVTLEHTGFETREILRLRLDVAPTPKDEDFTPPPAENPVTLPGDIWRLGEHRLICGSSTDREIVGKLLCGSRPHIMVTDPPYGVQYNPEWRSVVQTSGALRTGRVLNDDIADWRESWELFPGDVAYVWHAALHSETVANSLRQSGFNIRAQIIWAKPKFALSRGDYHWQHECCFYALKDDDSPGYYDGYGGCWYAVREGEKSHWQGSRSESTLWEIGFNEDVTTNHGTQKPVECMRRPMLNNSAPGELIYEPFCGSGTTIIAAESCRRICYAVELDPVYVDMAVKRFQEYAGMNATLDGTEQTFDDIARIRGEENGRYADSGIVPKRDSSGGAEYF
ncbi:MAG: site-specific DNA-methyltransferase [Synergistaceae bacterium]|nr:site-specific DNA-methyltransferase [Synergistaceae bacterium]